jgi:hypothetical protein
MWVRWTPTLAEERERFVLRHTCEDCAFFDPRLEVCRNGWPAGPHRRAFYENDPPGLILCKEFEPA